MEATRLLSLGAFVGYLIHVLRQRKRQATFLPHQFLLQGECRSKFAGLRANGANSSIIAGAYDRLADISSADFSCDTETVCIDIQTPSIFVDIRIPKNRPEVRANSVEELTIDEMRSLSSQHCFAGYSVVNHDRFGVPICTRYHAIDWRPPPRLLSNQWRIQPLWEKGGWVEWSVRMDSFNQAEYIEHWGTKGKSRAGPFLVLRRAGGEQDRDGFLVVAGDYFLFILGREAPLSAVTPGIDGHAQDRGLFTALVAPLLELAAAGDQDALKQLQGHFALQCSYGKRSSSWKVELSTFPWLEGKPLAIAQPGAAVFDNGKNCFEVEQTSANDGGGCWEVFDSTFSEGDELARLFEPHLPA
jgi:hypothetical protein